MTGRQRACARRCRWPRGKPDGVLVGMDLSELRARLVVAR